MPESYRPAVERRRKNNRRGGGRERRGRRRRRRDESEIKNGPGDGTAGGRISYMLRT
jgi:hypothetical protein